MCLDSGIAKDKDLHCVTLVVSDFLVAGGAPLRLKPQFLTLPASPLQRVRCNSAITFDRWWVIFMEFEHRNCHRLENITFNSAVGVKEAVFSLAKEALLQVESLAVFVAAVA